MNYDLHWSSPVRIDRFSGEEAEASKCPGIYLWIWKQGSGPSRIYYVGQAANVYERHREHVAMLMSGHYCTYNPVHVGDDFWKFWKDIRTDIELGIACTQYRRPKKSDDIPTRLNIAEWARPNMECTYVTWAQVDAAANTLRRIEAVVNHQIKSLMISTGIELGGGQRHIVPGSADKLSDDPANDPTITHLGANGVTALLPRSEGKTQK